MPKPIDREDLWIIPSQRRPAIIKQGNEFYPRTVPPHQTPNAWPYYTTASHGGINYNWSGRQDWRYYAAQSAVSALGLPGKFNILPNCVGYVLGRCMEAWGWNTYPWQLANCPSLGQWNSVVPNEWKLSGPVPGCVIYMYDHVAFCEGVTGNTYQCTESWYWNRSNYAGGWWYMWWDYRSYTIGRGAAPVIGYCMPPDISFAPLDGYMSADYMIKYLEETKYVFVGDNEAVSEPSVEWRE